jgi:hypothetical protein
MCASRDASAMRRLSRSRHGGATLSGAVSQPVETRWQTGTFRV